MWRYLKAAFWARPDFPAVGPLPLNALAVFAFGVLGGVIHPVWLLGLGLETAYLYLLATNPRFQKIVAANDLWQTRQNIGHDRHDLLARLPPEARARVGRLEDKIRRATTRGPEGADTSLLGDSNRDALEKLAALHLRLLGAEDDLRTTQQQADEVALTQQVTALETELHATGSPLSAAWRESKLATLTLTQKRLANARRRTESLAEIGSDLERIEAQVELALEDASQEGKPTLVASSLNLLNRILESNQALSSDYSPDRSVTTRTGTATGVSRIKDEE